jgi:hypothetical protein
MVDAMQRSDSKLERAEPITQGEGRTLIGEARRDLADGLTAGKTAAKSAEQDLVKIRQQAEEIGRLTAVDPLRERLRNSAYWLFGAGAVAFAAWLFILRSFTLLVEVSGGLVFLSLVFAGAGRWLFTPLSIGLTLLGAGLAMAAYFVFSPFPNRKVDLLAGFKFLPISGAGTGAAVLPADPSALAMPPELAKPPPADQMNLAAANFERGANGLPPVKQPSPASNA